MADYCRQCAEELFPYGDDEKDQQGLPIGDMYLRDLAGLITKEQVAAGLVMPALCEGCGPTYVDDVGRCVARDCEKHGTENVPGPRKG